MVGVLRHDRTVSFLCSASSTRWNGSLLCIVFARIIIIAEPESLTKHYCGSWVMVAKQKENDEFGPPTIRKTSFVP